MADRDWDFELRKIDKQLESVSDKELLTSTTPPPTPAAKAALTEKQASTQTFGVFARLVLAVLLGVGMFFWPYVSRCGIGLAAYLGAVLVLLVAGGWSAIWAWRHRAGRAHVLALLLVLWGLVLGAMEILPRTGYAKPSAQHPEGWVCTS